jgi:small-conductance mechanosensitive channel
MNKTHIYWVVGYIALLIIGLLAQSVASGIYTLSSGTTLAQLIITITSILLVVELISLVTRIFIVWKKKPAVEAAMVGRIYKVIGFIVIILAIASGLGQLTAFTGFFAMFGGMLLGWSLQAPVSGFAAWLLISLKRPFRPGDRIQFPNLGLTGDVNEIGPMYTILNQVGGTIGSEEASGREVLVPNAMLFSQVVINYTVRQEAAYILDEVIVRLTHGSNWDRAEQILLNAAINVTEDVIKETGKMPYIRADTYDYGVYMRLRYLTRATERPETVYKITKQIFKAMQQDREVDWAIPYVYSYRSGEFKRDEHIEFAKAHIHEINISDIKSSSKDLDSKQLEQLMDSIRTSGLLQPIVVQKHLTEDYYEVVAGELRLEACRRLGWKKIGAIVRDKMAV